MSDTDLPLLSEYGRILVHVRKQPTASQQELADVLGVSLRQANRLVTELRDGGYITTEPDGRRLKTSIVQDRPVGDNGLTLGDWIKRQTRKPRR